MRNFSSALHRMTRRQFVTGVASTGVIANLGSSSALYASSTPNNAMPLQGTEFALAIDEIAVNFAGKSRQATVVNGSLPAPLLRFREGDTIALHVTNHLKVSSSIHWHGLILPADMDGVPGLSFAGIQPGETFVYHFPVNQSGTYWYHSHSRFQEQTGLYGPIVIEPKGGERHHAERDYTVLLSDWTDEDPEHIYRTLKKHSDYFNFKKRTAVDFFNDARQRGWSAATEERRMWNEMRMDPTDIADVSGYTYTYLMNGNTPNSNWTGLFNRGEKIRLRFINGSSMSIFDVRIPGLTLKVVAADGQDIDPVIVDEFRIGTAEVYDVIVEPTEERAYTVFAQSIDRSGFARGTLTPRLGIHAEVPPLDPKPFLTMMDMGHDMSHGNATHSESAHSINTPAPATPDHSKMDHSKMNHVMPGINHSTTKIDNQNTAPIHHAAAEQGPGVDMTVSEPRSGLDDPGVGLRNNGRRVLTYADLHTIGGPIDVRGADREIELHLTGHMERFMWSFNGQKFSEAEPLRLKYGERVRIILVNDTMMNHPIHLHGMWSELEAPDGVFQVRKHTVMVQPAQRISYLVTADALGHWAYHCHLLYHMEAGMFREVIVEHDNHASHGAHP